MDVREFIKQKVAEGEKQVAIAKRCGISQGTVYKLLYTDTRPTMDIIMKIATGYGLHFSVFSVAEQSPEYSGNHATLTEPEKRLLVAFRKLDERRRERALETIEDMVLALKESGERGSPVNASQESNLERKSNG